MEVTRRQAREEAKKLVKDQMERHGIMLGDALFIIKKYLDSKKMQGSQPQQIFTLDL